MATDAARAPAPHTPAGTSVDAAMQALAERAKAFTEASEALRAEILTFQAALADAEGRPAERELKLVVSRETAEMEAIEQLEPMLAEPVASVPAAPRQRNLDRERLYADIGGAIIGLSAAAAVINFLLVK